MGRTVIAGDVHACARELAALLDAVGFAPGTDRLVLTGDVVARGPDPLGALDVARRAGARIVRGNHEARILQGGRLSAEHERVAAVLREEDRRVLEAMPLWIDLPEHGVRVVHGGVVPGLAIERTPPDALLTIRTIDAAGRWSDKRDAGEPWGVRYVGPPHVVFGHNALAEPQLHPWATGIDTGCVYGGRLTALVLGEGEPAPRGEAARAKLVSVPAAERYS